MTDFDAYLLRHLAKDLGLSKVEVLLVATNMLFQEKISAFNEDEKIFERRVDSLKRIKLISAEFGIKQQQAIYCCLLYFSRFHFETVDVEEFKNIIEQTTDKEKTSKDYENLALSKAMELGRYYDLSVKTISNLAVSVSFLNFIGNKSEIDEKKTGKTFRATSFNKLILNKIDDVGLLLSRFMKKIGREE
nr:hypothetical protein [uncultured Pseudogulbenkiania sp.]